MNKFINKKILYFFPSNHKEQEWQYYHFITELNSYNIKFELFNPNNYLPSYEEQLICIIKKNIKDISFFMTASFDNEISIETLKEIKKLGVPIVLICFDNLSIPFVHRKSSKYYDLVWLTSSETAYLFKRWGANTTFIPYAANPNVFVPSKFHNIRKCVGFVGSCYGNRPIVLNTISKNKIPTEIYTDLSKNLVINKNPILKNLKRIKHSFFYTYNLIKFPIGQKCAFGTIKKSLMNSENFLLQENKFLNIHDKVSFNQMIQLYSDFALTYNSIDLLDTFTLSNPVYKIHLRVFEVPMSGGLQITKRTKEILEYFEEDKEILLYDNYEELISKCHFYLKNLNIISKIKLNARLRALTDHSWKNRFLILHDKLFK